MINFLIRNGANEYSLDLIPFYFIFLNLFLMIIILRDIMLQNNRKYLFVSITKMYIYRYYCLIKDTFILI